MAIQVRKDEREMLFALVQQYNLLRQEVAQNLTSLPHMDITSYTTGNFPTWTTTPQIVTTTVAPTAIGLPSAIVAANALTTYINAHFADARSASALGGGAHLLADTVNPIVAAVASDQGTLNTLLNQQKANVNAHLSQAGVHLTSDGVNLIVAADASDPGTSLTLVEAIRAAVNAHIQFGLTSSAIHLVNV